MTNSDSTPLQQLQHCRTRRTPDRKAKLWIDASREIDVSNCFVIWNTLGSTLSRQLQGSLYKLQDVLSHSPTSLITCRPNSICVNDIHFLPPSNLHLFTFEPRSTRPPRSQANVYPHHGYSINPPSCIVCKARLERIASLKDPSGRIGVDSEVGRIDIKCPT